MWSAPENDQFSDEVYLASEFVPAGCYRQIGANREVILESDGRLPASFDGRIACYHRVLRWADSSEGTAPQEGHQGRQTDAATSTRLRKCA